MQRFTFADVPSSVRSYTITRLTPGEEYWFIVASVDAGNRMYWPQVWIQKFAVTAAPTPTPCPTSHGPGAPAGGDGTMCPITGLPLGDGYQEIGETFTWYRTSNPQEEYTATVLSAITPATITRVRQDQTEYQRTPPSGRRWLQVNMTLQNDLDIKVNVDGGHDYIMSTDAGIAFDWSGDRDLEPGMRYVNTTLSFDIPENATVTILAFRPIAEWGDDNAGALFRIPIPQ